MKKFICLCLVYLICLLPVQANTKQKVTFSKCTDGDTAHFIVKGKDTTIRFLAINAPEYTKEKEPYGRS